MKQLEMYQHIEDEVCRCIDLFDNWFSVGTFYDTARPEIIFAPLTMDAGQCMVVFEADQMFGNLVFNSSMVPLNFEKYIEVVVPHETAHWCHGILHGWVNDEVQNLNHGFQWQQIMQFLEADPRETIFDLKSPVINNLHHYGCDCSTINLDNEEKVEYGETLYCYNCECEYKLLKEGNTDEEDNP
jgi:predicted SprT family Zn-dependent metalloprotease